MAKVREKRDVEDLIIWALLDNGLGNMFSDQGGKLTIADLGTRVSGMQREGWSMAGPRVQHDDAFKVALRINDLPADPVTGERVMTELVVRHARTNCRPDWCEEGVGHSEEKRNKRGQVEWDYERPGDRKSPKLGPKMVWVGERPATVEFYRARYALWWIALKCLIEPLNEELEAFEVTGPRAPEEPWARGRVHAADGTQVFGLDGSDASSRLARLRRRGDVEIERPGRVPVQAMESASVGRHRGRS